RAGENSAGATQPGPASNFETLFSSHLSARGTGAAGDQQGFGRFAWGKRGSAGPDSGRARPASSDSNSYSWKLPGQGGRSQSRDTGNSPPAPSAEGCVGRFGGLPRPAGSGQLADRSGESDDREGHGQSHLELSFRRGSRHHSGR